MKFALTRTNEISSLLIRARLLEPWSHAVVIDTPDHIIDSTFKHGGVRRRDAALVLNDKATVELEHCPLDREAEAREFLYEQVGKRYDWRAVYGWAGAGRDWHDECSWFCFELVAAAIEVGSGYRFSNRNRVTGRDLQRAARTLRGEA